MDFTTGLLHTQAAGSLPTALGNKEGGVGILIPDLLLHFRSPEHWKIPCVVWLLRRGPQTGRAHLACVLHLSWLGYGKPGRDRSGGPRSLILSFCKHLAQASPWQDTLTEDSCGFFPIPMD